MEENRKRFVWDCETDGLFHTVTKVHCIVLYDMDAQELLSYGPDGVDKAIDLLNGAEFLCGMNIINYDLPVLEKLYPNKFKCQARIRDTLVMSRLLFPEIRETDFDLFHQKILPGALIGRHSLESWGYRLGELKGDYGKKASNVGADNEEDVWAEWNPEMQKYCEQDVTVTVKLYDHLLKHAAKVKYPEEAIVFEHRFADLMAKVERNGFHFNVEEAEKLYTELDDKRAALKIELQSLFPPWYKPAKWKTVEGTNKKSGKTFKKPADPWGEDSAEIETPSRTLNYKDPLKASRTEGASFCPIVLQEFNPGSRDMIADRLQLKFGWVPKEFTDTDKPKVSEDILRDLVGTLNAEEDGVEESEEELYDKFITAIPQAKSLADFFLIQKRLGQLKEGKNGWLKLVRDGKIHGSINTIGAVTRRVTHARPNVSQTPAVRSPYGKEMRTLWYTPFEWLQLGCDLSGVEIRCFANALAEFDGGDYANIVVNGDVHTSNMVAFGLENETNGRDLSKTTLYALLLEKSLRSASYVE